MGNYITIKVTKPTSCLNIIHLNDISMENHCKKNQNYNRSRQGKSTMFIKTKSMSFFKDARPTSSL